MAAMDKRAMLVDNLSEEISCELQKIIFAKTMKGEDPCSGGRSLYICDASCYFSVDKLKFKGPYEMYTQHDRYAHIRDLLSKQFKMIQNRARLLSKREKNTALKNVVTKHEKRYGKDAYTPTQAHIDAHTELEQYINHDLIPSKYVVLCVIAFSNEGFLNTTYHFVRWYSFDYVTSGFKKHSSSKGMNNGLDALNAMLSFAAEDEDEHVYTFPEDSSSTFDGETILLTPQDVWGIPK